MSHKKSLNRCFKLVWNAALRGYAVASELARSRGKCSVSSSPRLRAGALIVALAPASGLASSPSTVVPVGGNTSAYTAPNGVPVVDINTANAAGLSHNTFTRYDVGSEGLVLNNGNSDEIARQSQLAGQIYANPNLVNEAAIILNEVVSSDRSVLEGFTEVLGGTADLVVANPYGITCDGCGFINSDRATLSTGTPMIGEQGMLEGLNVIQGDVLIGAGGANMSAQQAFDIVARAVRLEGSIHTAASGSLGVTAGPNTWNYADRSAAPATPAEGDVPSYAIDSSVLGGMYAGRIRLIANEAGVGVRMLGDVAATADDFILNAAGQIEIQSAISAQNDLFIETNSALNADDLLVAGEAAALSAGNNLTLNTFSGQAHFHEADLYAGNNLQVSALSLDDTASGTASRFAAGQSQLNITGDTLINGSTWGSDGALSLTAASIRVGDHGATLYAGSTLDVQSQNELDLATASVIAEGDLSLSSSQGIITTAEGFEQAIQSNQGCVAVEASQGLTNSGSISSLNGALVLRVGSNLANSGTLYGQTLLDIADDEQSTLYDLINSGTILSDGGLSLIANRIHNAAEGQVQAGSYSNITTGDLRNDGSWLASTTATFQSYFDLDNLDNRGDLQAQGDLQLQIAQHLTNSGDLLAASGLSMQSGTVANSGTLQVEGGLYITAASLTNSGLINQSSTQESASFNLATLSNTASASLQSTRGLTLNMSGERIDNDGLISASEGLTITSTGQSLAINNGQHASLQAGDNWTLQYGSGMAGLLSIGGNAVTLNNAIESSILADLLNFDVASLSNAGAIQGLEGGSLIQVNGEFRNWSSGQLSLGENYYQQASTVSAASLRNEGLIQAGGGLDLNVSGQLSQTGQVLVEGALSSTSAGLRNHGTVQAQRADISTGTLNNTGDILTTSVSSTMRLTADELRNSSRATIQAEDDLFISLSGGNLTNEGVLSARDYFSISSSAAFNNLTLSNSAGATLVGNRLVFDLEHFDNDGTVQGGAFGAGGASQISTDTLANNGLFQSAGDVELNIGSFFWNRNTLLSEGSLAIRGLDDNYFLSVTANLEARQTLDIAGLSGGRGMDITVGSSGVLRGGTLNINADNLSLGGDGMVSSQTNMSLGLNSLSMATQTARIIGSTAGSGRTQIDLLGDLVLHGAIHSGADLGISADMIRNELSGGISALSSMTLSSATEIYNLGTLYAAADLNAHAVTDIRNFYSYESAAASLNAGVNMMLVANRVQNSSDISAGQNMTIQASSVSNFLAGDTRKTEGDPAGNNLVYDSVTDWNVLGDEHRTRTAYYHFDQSLLSGLSLAQLKVPAITAGERLSLEEFNLVSNFGGLFSADAINLQGLNDGAVFYNQAFGLDREIWSYTEYQYRDCNFISCGSWGNDPQRRNVWRQDRLEEHVVGAIGGQLRANRITGNRFGLVNAGAPSAVTVNTLSATAGNPASVTNVGLNTVSVLSSTNDINAAAVQTTTLNGVPAISFGGQLIVLPGSPNGYFVVSQDPAAQYLVETNPLFGVDSAFAGSDYLSDRYGYNPEVTQKRLGDADYEAYLIREQLISQTGTNLLSGADNEAEQFQGLMEQALNEGSRLGFTFGEALSEEQVAGLNQDVVWMVETMVAGQKVLAPVVYLSAATRASILGGAVIAANSIDLELSSLSNDAGTIIADDSMNIEAQGNIQNLSGTIAGGDVTLSSIEGSIVSETKVQGSGDASNYTTHLGSTATIDASGDLNLSAGEDIIVTGGQVTAGGDAALTAGENVTFDTVVDRSTETSGTTKPRGSVNTTTISETHIGSSLSTGGALSIESGSDTTVAGSDVTVGSDLSINTGGDLNIIARQDTLTTHSVETTSGAGVGGGLVGSETVTTDTFTGTNAGSTISVGGQADITSDGQLTLQGSDLTVAGDAAIEATDGIAVLDGLDEHYTTTKVETQTYFKIDNDRELEADAESKGEASSGTTFGKSSDSAKASAGVQGSSDMKISETSVEITETGSLGSVASSLNVGGDLSLSTDGALTVQGSDVSSGGDMSLNAGSVEVLSGRNEEWSTTQRTSTSVGLYHEAGSKAEAEAKAEHARGTSAGGAVNASAESKATAEASGTTTAGVKHESESSSYQAVTHTGASLNSGGDLSISATRDAVFAGAEVSSQGDMDIQAENITSLAVQDTVDISSSKTTHTAGLYVDGKTSAEAKAESGVKYDIYGEPIKAEAKAELKGDASAGIRYQNTSEASAEGSVTQVTSSFVSGGNFERNARDTITDQGTQIEAGQNITQSARALLELEASDSTYASTTSSSHDAKLGLGGSASASAGAGGNISNNPDAKAESGTSAGGGFRAKYAGKIEGAEESTTTAVTTRYTAGGNISSTTSEATSLLGTQIEAGGDIEIAAGELNFQAAQDTSNSSKNEQEIGAELKVDTAGKAGVGLNAKYGQKNESEETSTARAGGISAGGNLRVTTDGDANFEGTRLAAGEAAEIDARGDVNFSAARNTVSTEKSEAKAAFEASTSEGTKGAKASGGFSKENSDSSSAVGASIVAGTGISVNAGEDARFEGANVEAGGDIGVVAGGNVELMAAKDTSKTVAYGVEASAGAKEETKDRKTKSAGEGAVGGKFSYDRQVESSATSLSGANVTISGSTVVDQEAQINAEGNTSIQGDVVEKELEAVNESYGLELKVNAKKEQTRNDN